MKTAITTVVLIDSDGAHLLAAAKGKARELYERLTRTRQSKGSHRYEVTESEKTFYVSITVNAPFVQILVDSKKCPKFVSGLVWIEDFFEPTVREDEVDYLRSIYLKEAPTSKVLEASLANNANQMLTVRAGMYSGEMRKVVQVLQGMGRTISYNYRASETHGVFRMGNGVPWIIKISRAGVFAWPMNFCRGPNSPEALGYTPLPTAEPEEPRELLSAEVMESVYEGKGGFYGGCGWAFSASGAKAANCFVGSKDIYSYSWQYQITIAVDDSGNPVGAAVSVLAEGYIHGPKETHMKFPRGDNPTALSSFDPYRSNASYRNDSIAPVFCYFDGESLQTFYYLYTPNRSTSEVRAFTDGRSVYCTEFFGVPLYSGSWSESAVPTIKLNNDQPEFQTRDRTTEIVTTAEPRGIGIDDNGGTAQSFYWVWMRRRQAKFSKDNTTNDRTNVLVVTAFDREAAYLATRVLNQGGGFRFIDTFWAYRRYTVYWTPVDYCTATGDLTHISVQINSIQSENTAREACQSGYEAANVDGVWTYLGAGVGSTIVWRDQRISGGPNACYRNYEQNATFLPANISDQPSIDINVPQSTRVDYTFVLHRSGAASMPMRATNEDIGRWMTFIEPGMNDQTAQVVRDAFDQERMAASIRPNETRGFEMFSDVTPYDLSLVTGSTFTFVGVP
ncbi:MAG: hypothetical protein RLZ44_608 [Pseudomonadota bacterium]